MQPFATWTTVIVGLTITITKFPSIPLLVWQSSDGAMRSPACSIAQRDFPDCYCSYSISSYLDTGHVDILSSLYLQIKISVFYLTSLIIVGSAITKHRNAGGHNYFGSQPPTQLVAVFAPLPHVYGQHPAPVYTQHQTAYYQQPQQPQMQQGQNPTDYSALQQRYSQLQAQHATLQQQVQRGSTASPLELKGNV